MKGILLKDFLSQRLYAKSMGAVLLLFLLLGVIQRSLESTMIMFSTMIMLFTMIASINSVAIDDACKWDCYAAAMPLRRSDIVREKYLMFSLLAVGGGVLVFLLGLAASLFFAVNQVLLLLMPGGMALLSLLMLSILLPLVYKFGAEKARLFIIGIVLIPTLLIILAQTAGVQNPFAPDGFPAWLFLALPLLVLALLFGSYALSARIFSRKDL